MDTKELDNHGWLMVVGRVVAASVNEDCIDENGWAILDKLHPLTITVKPIYSGDNRFRFVASYEVMEVDTVYDVPEASRVQLDGLAASVNHWQVGVIFSAASYISTKTVDEPVGKLFSYPVMQALQSIH